MIKIKSMTDEKIYNCLILNDTPGNHYADMVFKQKKTTETRMRTFKYSGDLIICCGETNSVTSNAGKALCLVEMLPGRPMTKEDEKQACIECVEGRIAYPLVNFRYFNRQFIFKKHKVSGTWQGIFQIKLPKDVTII